MTAMSENVLIDCQLIIDAAVDADVYLSGSVQVHSIELLCNGQKFVVDGTNPIYGFLLSVLDAQGFDSDAQDAAGLTYRGRGANDPDGHFVWRR